MEMVLIVSKVVTLLIAAIGLPCVLWYLVWGKEDNDDTPDGML